MVDDDQGSNTEDDEARIYCVKVDLSQFKITLARAMLSLQRALPGKYTIPASCFLRHAT